MKLEKEHLHPHVALYHNLRLNRLLVWAMAAVTISTLVVCGVVVYRMHVYHLNHALAVSGDGKVIPLEYVERNRVIAIQMKEHLHDFFHSYYTFDQNNMVLQREKGLWLISQQDGAALEQFYEEQGWFNNIIRKGLNQQANIVEGSLEFSGQNPPYQFKCQVEIEVHPMGSPEFTDTYHMQVAGELSLASAVWPVNPEGLIIHHYRESPWKKVVAKK